MAASRLVHRTARIRLRVTCRQADRCYALLRSAGDVWASVLDANRERFYRGDRQVIGYIALCHELTGMGNFGELSVTGARSVLQRCSDAWFQAAKRRRNGEPAGFPRRKRALVPVRFYHGTFLLDGPRIRMPVAKGQPELWVRLARPIPYPVEQVRAVTLLADGGRLWLAVTAAVPVQQHDLASDRVGGVDLGIIHPYAVVTQNADCSSRGVPSGPKAIYTCAITKLGRLGQPAAHPNRDSGARAAGAATDRSSAGLRPVTAAASIRPTTRPPSRSSLSPANTGWGYWWSVTPRASPAGTSVACRTSDCGSGAAPT
jgi:hypothetical protein